MERRRIQALIRPRDHYRAQLDPWVTNQLTDELNNQLINQLINQMINQMINQTAALIFDLEMLPLDADCDRHRFNQNLWGILWDSLKILWDSLKILWDSLRFFQFL